MSIVYRRAAIRRYRYGGSGIIDTIVRAMFSSGAKAISSGASSAVAQKVANTVVNGATCAAKETANAALKGATIAAQRAGERAINETIKAVVTKATAKRKRKKRKRPASTVPAAADAKRININSLIDGSGILLD